MKEAQEQAMTPNRSDESFVRTIVLILKPDIESQLLRRASNVIPSNDNSAYIVGPQKFNAHKSTMHERICQVKKLGLFVEVCFPGPALSRICP